MSRKQKVFILVISALVSLSIWFYQRIIYDAPSVPITSISDADLVKINDTHFTLNNSWLRLNKHDNWECYLEGNGYERGITLGILQKELGKNQESVFIDEINKNVPSWWFRKFLILGISWFNRDKKFLEFQNPLVTILIILVQNTIELLITMPPMILVTRFKTCI